MVVIKQSKKKLSKCIFMQIFNCILTNIFLTKLKKMFTDMIIYKDFIYWFGILEISITNQERNY